MSMTQKELVMSYVETFGEIIPAKIGGKPWNGGFFGSETSKRCRELRQEGRLASTSEGKFEKFYLPQRSRIPEGQLFAIDQYQMQ